MENNYKRRNYFIDKKFQTNFILAFCVIVVVSSLLILMLLLFLSRHSNTVMIENTRVIAKTTADFMFPLAMQTLFTVFLFSGISVGVLTLFVSHKISGPLFRLAKEVEEVKSGDLTRSFRIRDHDQLQSLPEHLKTMTAFLNQEIKDMKNEVSSLKTFLSDAKMKISEDEKAKIDASLKSLDDKLNKFKTS
ncbi:MAG: hypothetical protein PHY73_04980 [Candidatus Omnitrophica bacterium]|nr:hypothetical protein [Candidatus Omnitrophota bacterium]